MPSSSDEAERQAAQIDAVCALMQSHKANRLTAHSHVISSRDLLIYHACNARKPDDYHATHALMHCETAGVPREELLALLVLLRG